VIVQIDASVFSGISVGVSPIENVNLIPFDDSLLAVTLAIVSFLAIGI
jgi:hypothetical protein